LKAHGCIYTQMHAYVHTRIRTRGRECVLHARVAAVGTTCLPASPASSPTRPLLRPSSPCLHASLLPCLSAPASLPRLPPSIPRCQTVTEGVRAFFLLPPPPLPPGLPPPCLPSPLPPFPPASRSSHPPASSFSVNNLVLCTC